MFEVNINVNITGLECLAESIRFFAEKMPAASTQSYPEVAKSTSTSVGNTPTVPTPDPAANTAVAGGYVPEQNTPPMQNPAPAQNSAQNTIPQTQAVPTSVPSYQLNDLSNAAMALMDCGRQAELIKLLSGFGVPSLPDLPAERYGEFATALRGMGAPI